MGIKEGTSWEEHWVLGVSDESLNSTPETISHDMSTNLNLNKYILNGKNLGVPRWLSQSNA